MIYTCKRCGYETKEKWLLKRHLGRMKACIAVIDDAPSVTDLITELDYDNRYKSEVAALHVCPSCNKAYHHATSLIRHKTLCKDHHAELLKERMESEIMAKVKDMLEQSSHVGTNNTHVTNNTSHVTHNNNVINNNSIHIHINKFGIEDRSYIPDMFLTKCLKQRGNGVVELARVTHFHKNHPCNKNVRAKNMTSLVKYGVLEIFNGEKWTPADSDTVLKQIFDRHYTALDDHLGNNEDELRKELGAVLYANIEKWYDQVRNCDPDKTRDVKDTLRKLKWLILENS